MSTVGESHICLDLNGVFGGKTCRGLRVIGVNFHICWKRACVKDLTNIMSALRQVLELSRSRWKL